MAGRRQAGRVEGGQGAVLLEMSHVLEQHIVDVAIEAGVFLGRFGGPAALGFHGHDLGGKLGVVGFAAVSVKPQLPLAGLGAVGFEVLDDRLDQGRLPRVVLVAVRRGVAVLIKLLETWRGNSSLAMTAIEGSLAAM